jgi:hypothetical protein
VGRTRFQGSRFEQKYIVTEEVALQIRDFIGSHFELDEHGAGKPNFSYPVHSVYLDSDDLKLYWSTINGDKNRFKLRLRFYDDDPNTPVFCEIKQRTNKCLVKKRVAVRRDTVDQLLAGRTPQLSLLSSDPHDLAALKEFRQRTQELKAIPAAHIAYAREAYMTRDDNSARLTMDRQVRVAPARVSQSLGEARGDVQTSPRFPLSTTMLNPTLVWGNDVVLELKFIDRRPDCFGELVRIFGLRECGAAKYIDGVATLGEHKLGR